MKLRPMLIALAALALLLRLAAYKALSLPFGTLADAMCQYDCGWYLRIADKGYMADAEFANFGHYPHFAFFPLFPLLLRIGLILLPGAGDLSAQAFAGMVVANILYFGCMVMTLLYAQRTRPNMDPRLLIVVLVLAPYGYFFSSVYTEGLFAGLLLLACLTLAERRAMACAVVIALLCATRPTGVIMLLPLGLERAAYLWQGRTRPDRVALLAETLMPLAIAPLGLSLFMALQYAESGDAMAFSHVQILWDRHWVGPLAMLRHGFGQWDWTNLLDPKAQPSQSYDAAWAVLGLAVSAGLALRRRFTEAWVMAACVLLPLATGLHSLARFVGTNPIFLLVLTGWLQHVRRGMTLAVVVAGLVVLHAATLELWFVAANSAY